MCRAVGRQDIEAARNTSCFLQCIPTLHLRLTHLLKIQSSGVEAIRVDDQDCGAHIKQACMRPAPVIPHDAMDRVSQISTSLQYRKPISSPSRAKTHYDSGTVE